MTIVLLGYYFFYILFSQFFFQDGLHRRKQMDNSLLLTNEVTKIILGIKIFNFLFARYYFFLLGSNEDDFSTLK